MQFSRKVNHIISCDGASHFGRLLRFMLNMLLGRLEIFPLVMLAFPGIWKRAR